MGEPLHLSHPHEKHCVALYIQNVVNARFIHRFSCTGSIRFYNRVVEVRRRGLKSLFSR